MLIIIVIKLNGKRNAKQYRSVCWINAINTEINSLITESLLKIEIKILLSCINFTKHFILYFIVIWMKWYKQRTWN